MTDTQPINEAELEAAWGGRVPPGLKRKLERASSPEERAAIAADLVAKGKRREARRKTGDLEPVVSVKVAGQTVTISYDGRPALTLTKGQAAALRLALNPGKGN